MPQIEGFRVQNYRVLRDVAIGRVSYQDGHRKLTPFTAVIGKNGSGKSTLFDAFGFIADCLSTDVESACDMRQRGGYERLLSAGCSGPLWFTVYYREGVGERPITYELSIAADASGRPFVESEVLKQRRKGQKHGQPFPFMRLSRGKGEVWAGEESVETPGEEDPRKMSVELTDVRQLGVVSLGAFKEHPRIERFRSFLKSWYLSYFYPDAARGLPASGPQKRLNVHGDNLANVVQYLEREDKPGLQRILKRIADKIPGIANIGTTVSPDKRVLLQFNDGPFLDPFFAQQMSDGTLKLFTYYLLMETPEVPPFICIEEPENGLYHQLLETFANDLREYANRSKNGAQIFVTTHQPFLVNALTPKEVWMLEKGKDGFAHIFRASDVPEVNNLVEEELPLGGLWSSDYLGEVVRPCT